MKIAILIIVVLLINQFIYDKYVQRKSSLLINYPVLARMRYLFEQLREPLRQYFGEELFNRLKIVDPNISFILCSGYSEDVNEENAHEIGLAAFLMKPASKNDIAFAAYTALRGKRNNLTITTNIR